MLVRSYGFSVEAGNSRISIADLFSAMAELNGQPDNSMSNERRFYIDNSTDPDFILGVVVTVKNQKSFCELVNDGGGFVISVKNLSGDNKLMEFNFFVVNKKNGHGIYQYYHQSCSLGSFGNYLKSRYFRMSSNAMDEAIAKEAVKPGFNAKLEKSIAKEFRKGLTFTVLTHNESLGEVLSRFHKIQSFEYEYSSLAPDHIAGAPIGPYVRKVKQKVVFNSDSNPSLLGSAIQKTVDMLKPKSGHVGVIDCIDDEDVPLSIRIADIPEHFGEYDYDVIAAKLDKLDVEEFSTHAVIADLLNTCRIKYRHIFMKLVKP